jgi:GR25 family glycosyltransferase involved in LPS biosynthesis
MNQRPFFPRIQIYIMNTPNRGDRRDHMRSMLESIGANAADIVFSSENAGEIPFIAKKDVTDRAALVAANRLTESASRKLNDPYVANALGHLEYIKAIARSGKPGIIMEDDIIPTVDPRDVGVALYGALAELPQDADMLFMEACHENCNKIKRASSLLYRMHSPQCSAAIFYTAAGARKVAELYTPVFGAIDGMAPELISNGKIVAYGIDGMLFAQDEFYGSDAMRTNETQEQLHRVRLPICNSGQMAVKHSLMPIKPKFNYWRGLLVGFAAVFAILFYFILTKYTLSSAPPVHSKPPTV